MICPKPMLNQKTILFAALLAILPPAAQGRPRGCWADPHANPPIEITDKDLTKLGRLCSLDLSVYGVRLGMQTSKALLTLHQYEFAVKEDEQAVLGRRFHNIRVLWEGSEIVTIAIKSDRVDEIVLQRHIASYLPGESPHLFDPEMADRDSPLRRRYFGREDRVATDSSQNLTTVSYFYGAEGVEVRGIRLFATVAGKGISDPSFHILIALTYPEKQRQ